MKHQDRTSNVAYPNAAELQNRFLSLLARYVNGGVLRRRDIFLSMCASTLPYLNNADTVLNLYRQHLKYIPATPANGIPVDIDPYSGANPYVQRMMEYLAGRLAGELYGAYVHGSLGTQEEVNYSDFDALVILRNEVFESRKRLIRVATALREATRIMFEFDPLQHHGWFVTTQADLSFYSDAWLPVEALRRAKSLLPEARSEIVFCVRDSASEARDAFARTARSVAAKLTEHRPPSNAYELKSLLSEFLLLPALYLQALEGRGVFKGDSFDMARQHFTNEEWRIMDEVSDIRRHWSYELSGVRRRALCAPHALRKYVARHGGPRLPAPIARRLDRRFYRDMAALVERMRGRFIEARR
ncbi:MAG: hypothetical protein AB1560_01115 [Pseudomonadota bacterium]